MPQVVAYARQLRAARKCMTGVGVPHPVRARAAQFFRQERMITLKHASGLKEEPAHDAPQVRARNTRALMLAEAGKDRRSRGSTPEPQKIPSFHIVNVNRFVA